MPLHLRPVNAEVDYPRLARLESLWDAVPVSAEELRHLESSRSAGTIFHRIIIVDDAGWIAGTAKAIHTPEDPAGHFFVVVIVDPTVRRQGIGTQLYDAILAFAREYKAVLLETIAGEGTPGALTFAWGRDFTIHRQLSESTLDLTAFDPRRFTATIARVTAGGIRFLAWAELEGTDGQERTLYELYTAMARDAPGGEARPPAPFEQFRRDVLESPTFLADGLILAVADERWIGLTHLVQSEPDLMYNQFTGVLREFRGRGIALGLKLAAIAVCRRYGVAQVKTINDAQNGAMLAINRTLGYAPEPNAYILRKEPA